MTGIAERAIVVVIGDGWHFPVRYGLVESGAPIDLAGLDLSGSAIRWPGGQAALAAGQVVAEEGRWRLSLAAEATAAVPAGRGAELHVRVIHPDDGPQTIAIVPLNVVNPPAEA